MLRHKGLWAGALSLFLAGPLLDGSAFGAAEKAKPSLDGKRPSDKLLLATDAQRTKFPTGVLEMALRRHGAKRVALRADFVRSHNTSYAHELPKTKIRNQKSSGRCWIFTALNVIEQDYAVRTKRNIKLSRAWINAKNLQATAYELLKEGAEANAISFTADNDIGEGGHFAYALHLLDKYGAVPEHVMRDFQDSGNSGTVVKLLETVVADAQNKLRATDKNSEAAIAIIKQAQSDIDRTIALAFTGKATLPERFVYGGKEHTPKSFASEYLAVKPDDYVTLSSQDNLRKGWREGGEGVHKVEIYNTGSVDIMKEAVRNAVDQGKKAYISVPVGDAAAPYMTGKRGKDGKEPAPGVMSIAAFDYVSLGFPKPNLDRSTIQRLRLHPSNHAMTILDYDPTADKKGFVKWKVENSWGEDAADHGIQHMYDDFMTHFVGVVTVPRSALPEGLAKEIAADEKREASIKWEPK